MQNTLFDAELSVHKFGSHLLHVASLKNWADSKGFHFPKTNPPIEDYEFVQVEALLVAIMRVVHSSMTPEDAFRDVQNDSKLNGHELAQHSSITARWLIGADIHSQWRKEISAAINKQELKLLKRGSLLPVTSEDLEVLLSSMPHIESNAATVPAIRTEKLIEEELSSLFNGVSKQQLAAMFNVNQDTTDALNLWSGYIRQANKNDLKKARISHGKYNPYKAGIWWLDKKKPKGWTLEKLNIRLAKNLPERSKGMESRLTGEDYN
jgi:hypothetical protein